MEVTHLVAMCNYRANRLACDAADRAMQTCGGVGYSRHMPFEHIYRHHRRYRITEGSEEIQMRKVGQRAVRLRALMEPILSRRCSRTVPSSAMVQCGLWATSHGWPSGSTKMPE